MLLRCQLASVSWSQDMPVADSVSHEYCCEMVAETVSPATRERGAGESGGWPSVCADSDGMTPT